jgi:hypothetical protein
MEGEISSTISESSGILPRTAEFIKNEAANQILSGNVFEVEVCAIEIYCE